MKSSGRFKMFTLQDCQLSGPNCMPTTCYYIDYCTSLHYAIKIACCSHRGNINFYCKMVLTALKSCIAKTNQHVSLASNKLMEASDPKEATFCVHFRVFCADERNDDIFLIIRTLEMCFLSRKRIGLRKHEIFNYFNF